MNKYWRLTFAEDDRVTPTIKPEFPQPAWRLQASRFDIYYSPPYGCARHIYVNDYTKNVYLSIVICHMYVAYGIELIT